MTHEERIPIVSLITENKIKLNKGLNYYCSIPERIECYIFVYSHLDYSIFSLQDAQELGLIKNNN